MSNIARRNLLRTAFALPLILGLGSMSTFAADVPATGSWQLVKRKLPDGTIQIPPVVGGMSTTTASGVNHKNIFWQTPDGKHSSISSIAAFKWSDTELSVTSMFSAFDDGSGKPAVYGAAGETKRAPVKREGGRISYQHPFDPPFIVIDGDKMTATAEGLFTDYWERVK